MGRRPTFDTAQVIRASRDLFWDKGLDGTSLPDLDGEILFHESGGSWLVVLIGPLLVGAVLLMEILGPGQVHWPVLAIFFVPVFFVFVLGLFSRARGRAAGGREGEAQGIVRRVVRLGGRR